LRIGVPKEIKDHEYRVGLVPSTVRELVARGHPVMVDRGAGSAAGIADAEYEAAGAEIVAGADAIFERAEMIVKVKEPLAAERPKLKRGQILFTYLHLAADRVQTEGLLNAGVIGIAYETVTAADGNLPLLTPMSAVAGRMAPQVGAYCLQKANGGRGVLLAGVPGVEPGSVLILGAGHVGANAALIAVGMGANVTVVGRSKQSLGRIAAQFGDRVRTEVSERAAIERLAREADLVIGAAMVPGGVAPKLLSRETVQAMRRGAVIVDVAIDQGGVAETSRPTSHSQPTYIEEGVVHYCVPNMPGAVPRTSTFALNNATRPFVLALADKGWRQALSDDPHLLAGLNVHEGRLTYRAVAEALQFPYTPAKAVLST
jgi:alanine dehydrogenase